MPPLLNHLRFTAIAVLAVLAAASFASQASAQVVVYKMSFKPLRSFNLGFYDSGYFVAPLTNASSTSSSSSTSTTTTTTSTGTTKTGSFIFTITKTRPCLYTATGTGQVFTIVKPDGSTHWGVRADNTSSGSSSTTTTTTTTSGTASSSYMAFGPVMKRMTFSGSTYKIKMGVPTHLKGGAVASSDESDVADGRTTDIGFASTFEWKLLLDEEETAAANTAGHDVAATITALTDKLKSHGFKDENDTGTTDNTNSGGNNNNNNTSK